MFFSPVFQEKLLLFFFLPLSGFKNSPSPRRVRYPFLFYHRQGNSLCKSVKDTFSYIHPLNVYLLLTKIANEAKTLLKHHVYAVQFAIGGTKSVISNPSNSPFPVSQLNYKFKA
jgi:hypothetical protein